MLEAYSALRPAQQVPNLWGRLWDRQAGALGSWLHFFFCLRESPAVLLRPFT